SLDGADPDVRQVVEGSGGEVVVSHARGAVAGFVGGGVAERAGFPARTLPGFADETVHFVGSAGLVPHEVLTLITVSPAGDLDELALVVACRYLVFRLSEEDGLATELEELVEQGTVVDDVDRAAPAVVGVVVAGQEQPAFFVLAVARVAGVEDG